MGLAARYETVLWPTRSDRQPSRFLLVHAAGRKEADPESTRIRHTVLTSWASMWWTRERGIDRPPKSAEGQTRNGFWDLLCMLCRSGGHIWSISHESIKTWSMLGLWHRIEDGTVRIVGDDERNVEEGRESASRSVHGRCILEDPPVAVSIRPRGLPATVQILDWQNFGVPQSSKPGNGPVALPSVSDVASPAGETEMVSPLLALSRDSVSLSRMIGVLESRGLGSLKATAGSQAIYSYRRKHLHPGMLIHVHYPTLELEQKSIHGGRCEAYRIGKVDGPCYLLDVRSHYPSICMEMELPVCLKGFGDAINDHTLPDNVDHWSTVCEVQIRTEDPVYPKVHNGSVIFPVGQFWTTLAGPELNRAFLYGHILRYGRYATYYMAPALREAAREWYDIRCELERSDTPWLADWAKKVLVCLVGKWAQRGKVWSHVPDASSAIPYGTWREISRSGVWERYRSIAGRVELEEDTGFGRLTIPAITAWVYSWGRDKLWDIMCQAGRENVYYADTDSVIVNKEGYVRLECPSMGEASGPGMLRGLVSSWGCQIHGVKHYSIGTRHIRSGPTAISPQVGVDAIAYWTGDRAKDSIAHRERPGEREVLRKYTLPQGYMQGIVQDDGSVRPFRLQES